LNELNSRFFAIKMWKMAVDKFPRNVSMLKGVQIRCWNYPQNGST